MLKRLLIFWYLLFSLAYGSAWALSCQADAGHGHSLSAVQHDGGSGAASGGCPDHCGHASAHTLGFTPQPVGLKSGLSRTQHPALEKRLVSLRESPPVPPPSV